MCSKGAGSPPVPGGTSTAFQSATAPNPNVGPMYQNFLSNALNTSQTPFNPAMLGTAAPMTPEQTQAGEQVFNLGLTMGQFDPSQVQAIESPYTQDVVNATQNWFNNQNAIQGSGLMGQAIRSGNAFGGDRAGIAEAQLAGQQQMAQAPVIAGLEQAGYTQALGEYNQLKQMGLTGAEAALQWGNQQQAQTQRELDVQQQNAMMQQAYPFQLQNWYGSVLGGIGPLQGSSALGYTTPPPPSLASQIGAIAGPLAGLAGAIFRRGGSVPRKLNGGLEHRGLVRVPGRFQDGGGLSDSDDAGPLYAGALTPSTNVNIRGGNPSDPYGALSVGGRSMRTIPNVVGGGPRVPMRVPSFPSLQGQQQAAATQQQTQQQKQQQDAQAIASTGGAALGLAGLGALALLKRGGAIPHFQDGGADDGYLNEDNATTTDSGDDAQPIPLPPITVAGAPVPTAASTDPTTSTTSPAPGWTSPNAQPSWLPGATARPSTAPPTARPSGSVPVADGRGGYSMRHIPGLERPQKSFMQRWLSNPLTQMGAAMGASRSPYWSEALGRGFQAAGAAAEQQHKQDVLDQTPRMITAGGTVQFLTGSGDLIDTGLKTPAGQSQGIRQQQLDIAQRRQRLMEAMPHVIGHDANFNPIYGRFNPDTGGYDPIESPTAPVPRAPTSPSTTGAAGPPPMTPLPPGTSMASEEPGSQDRPPPMTTLPPGTSMASMEPGSQNRPPPMTPAPPPADTDETTGVGYTTPKPPPEPVDYRQDPGEIKTGQELGAPLPIPGLQGSTHGGQQLMQDAENYLMKGEPGLPKVSRGRWAAGEQAYVTAVKNYANALRQAAGITTKEQAEKWFGNPYRMRWLLGVQGRGATATGTAMRHLDSLEEAYKALNNKDWQTLNKIKNYFGIEMGEPAPKAVQAMAGIVGAEVTKAVVGAQSGQAEREAAAKQYGIDLSPRQFAATKSRMHELFAGRLEGMRADATNAYVTPQEFERQVGKRELAALNDIVRQRSARPTTESGGTSAAPAKPDVTQGGHTYHWNSSTGKYEAVR